MLRNITIFIELSPPMLLDDQAGLNATSAFFGDDMEDPMVMKKSGIRNSFNRRRRTMITIDDNWIWKMIIMRS
uniref:Uncharacterized protein n=1 Tax=Caenorhabditis tropicalis TaxID=1561998 RepID=A0A1I7T8Y5_9PELO